MTSIIMKKIEAMETLETYFLEQVVDSTELGDLLLAV